MTIKKQIEIYKDMLKEFDYDKNTLEDTLQFLLIMCNDIYFILNKMKTIEKKQWFFTSTIFYYIMSKTVENQLKTEVVNKCQFDTDLTFF